MSIRRSARGVDGAAGPAGGGCWAGIDPGRAGRRSWGAGRRRRSRSARDRAYASCPGLAPAGWAHCDPSGRNLARTGRPAYNARRRPRSGRDACRARPACLGPAASPLGDRPQARRPLPPLAKRGRRSQRLWRAVRRGRAAGQARGPDPAPPGGPPCQALIRRADPAGQCLFRPAMPCAFRYCA